MSNIRVCLAGATGWAGSELARGIGAAEGLSLVAGVSRSHAGKTVGSVLDEPALGAPIFASATAALAGPGCDVFVEFTKPAFAKANITNPIFVASDAPPGALDEQLFTGRVDKMPSTWKALSARIDAARKAAKD